MFVQSAILCSEGEVQFGYYSLGYQDPHSSSPSLHPPAHPNSPNEKGITGNRFCTKKDKRFFSSQHRYTRCSLPKKINKNTPTTNKAFISQFRRQNACEQLQRQPRKSGKISHYYRVRKEPLDLKKKKKKEVNTSEDCR